LGGGRRSGRGGEGDGVEKSGQDDERSEVAHVGVPPKKTDELRPGAES
jgi:hypothetical protein